MLTAPAGDRPTADVHGTYGLQPTATTDTGRAALYGSNSIGSICCGFVVQLTTSRTNGVGAYTARWSTGRMEHRRAGHIGVRAMVSDNFYFTTNSEKENNETEQVRYQNAYPSIRRQRRVDLMLQFRRRGGGCRTWLRVDGRNILARLFTGEVEDYWGNLAGRHRPEIGSIVRI